MEIVGNNFTSTSEQFNHWYYNHLLGGNTSPYCAYTAAANRYQKNALYNFCLATCPKKFDGNICKCKKPCNKYKDFEFLTYTK